MMKNFILLITIGFLVWSCNLNDKIKTDKSPESPLKVRDTTITYKIEDVSTEGTEINAYYIENIIKKCTIHIYGETGQSEMIYNFKKDQIDVILKNYKYAVESGNINQQNWKTEKEIKYTIDYDGLLISGNAKEDGFVDMFPELKKNVPFQLKLKKY